MGPCALDSETLSLESLEHLIDDVQYHTFKGTNTTVCSLALKDGNGYGFIGMSDLRGNAFTKEDNEAGALQDALAKLNRHVLNSKHNADSAIVPRAVDDTKLN